MDAGACREVRGTGTRECWIRHREERQEQKDEVKVNEESDAAGNLSLAPDTHRHLSTMVKAQ